jgi:hypothetical protein
MVVTRSRDLIPHISARDYTWPSDARTRSLRVSSEMLHSSRRGSFYIMNIRARQGEEDIERRIARGRGADLCLWDKEAAAARFMGPSASRHLTSIGRALVSNDRVGVASHIWPAIRVEGNKMWHRKGDAGGGANHLVLLLEPQEWNKGYKENGGLWEGK